MLVVADLVDQFEAGEHHHRRTGDPQAIDRTVGLGELHQVEERHLAFDVEQVADDGVGRGLWNGLQIGLAAHCSLLVLALNMSRAQNGAPAGIYTARGRILQ